MGLLKHAILPFFAIMHGMSTYMSFFADRSEMPSAFGWPPNSVETDGAALTLYEDYLFGILGCFHASFLVGCLVGVLFEHAHFRAVFAGMEAVMWGLGGINAVGLGFPHVACWVFAGMAVVGIGVQMKEPGIFTRDKGAKGKDR